MRLFLGEKKINEKQPQPRSLAVSHIKNKVRSLHIVPRSNIFLQNIRSEVTDLAEWLHVVSGQRGKPENLSVFSRG